MTHFPSDLELIDGLRDYVAELERELRFVEAQKDAMVKTFHEHSVKQAGRISDLERALQAQLDRGRPA